LLLLLYIAEFHAIKDDLMVGIAQIIIALVSFNANLTYSNEFKKLFIKNEINIGRLSNIFNNIKQSLISIDITNYQIKVNLEFNHIIEHLGRENIHEGFNLTNLEHLNNFKKIDDFYVFLKQFDLYDNFNKYERKEKKMLKKLIFFKKLYYIYKIFNYLRNSKNEALNFETILKSDFFDSKAKFKQLDSFTLTSKITNENEYYGISFRKSKIQGVEIIDIMLTNNTEVIKTEQEKAANKYRKSYLSNIAHEFKAPIQVLILSVNELSKRDLPKTAASLLKDIENLGNYILIMVMDIISFSKEELGISVKFESFESQNPFKFGFQLLQLLIKHNNTKCYAISTELIIDDNVPKLINSDENRIKQLVVNLISNAYKFTLSGKIIIKVLLITTNALYDEILVQVDDTGIGIPEKDRLRLFNQFEKLQDTQDLNRQGTGLGLFICKGIVEKIGIKIGFKAKKNGNGSIFYFSFANMKNNELCKQIEEIKQKSPKKL